MPERSLCFNGPTLSYLTRENISQIHGASLHILEQIGCKILHPGVRDLLAARGVTFDSKGRALIPESLVSWA